MAHKLLCLADLKASTAVTAVAGVGGVKQYPLGTVAVVHDATYGPIKAIYVESTALLSVVGGPAYPILTSGAAGWAADFTVNEDDATSGCSVLLALGPFLATIGTGDPAKTVPFYGWVQLAGLNPVTMTNSGADCVVGDILIPETTPGTWIQGTFSATNTDPNINVASACGRVLVAQAGTTCAVGTIQISSAFSGLPVTL